jgi:TetR/AcrR family transcriptional repressor of mexJK operon
MGKTPPKRSANGTAVHTAKGRVAAAGVIGARVRSPIGRPKDPQRRAAILKAAGDAFMEFGYEGVTLDQIAERAGVSKLTIYSHFSDKLSLFDAIISEKCREYGQSDTYESFTEVNPADALKVIGRNFLKLVLSREAIAMHRLVSTEAPRNSALAEQFFAAGPEMVTERLVALMTSWAAHGALALKSEDAKIAAEQFLSLLLGKLHMRVLFGLAPDLKVEELEEHVGRSVELFLARYAGERLRAISKSSGDLID